MAPKKKIGDYTLKNIIDAYRTESEALSKIHIAVSNQLQRLKLEEQALEQLLQEAMQREQRQQQQAAVGGQQQLEGEALDDEVMADADEWEDAVQQPPVANLVSQGQVQQQQQQQQPQDELRAEQPESSGPSNSSEGGSHPD